MKKLMILTIVAALGTLSRPTLSHAEDMGQITSGQTRSGAIDTAGEEDTWTFSATAGDRVIVQVAETANYGSFTPNVQVFAPNRPTVVASQTSDAAILEFNAPETGTFTIVIADADRNTSNTYALTLVNLMDSLTSSGDLDGDAIVSGQTLEGHSAASDLDVFQFSAQAGDRVIVQVTETANYGSYTPKVEVRGPDLVTVLDTVTSDGAVLEFTVPRAGTHSILISDDDIYTANTYALTLVNLMDSLTSSGDLDGDAIVSGQTLEGHSAASDLDVFQFSAQAGDRVIVQVTETANYGSYTPKVEVRGPDLVTVLDTVTSDGAVLEFTVPRAGTHSILISDDDIYTANTYALTLVNLMDSLTSSGDLDGDAIVSGQTLEGHSAASDLDVFQFSAQAGDRVIVQVTETANYGSYTPKVEVRGPDLVTVLDTVTSDGAVLEFTVPRAGTHSILISDDDIYTANTYALTLVNLMDSLTSSGDLDGGVIPSNSVYRGNSQPSDLDVFVFCAQVGDPVVIEVKETVNYGSYTPLVEVRSPDRVRIIASSTNDTVVLSFTASESGIYLVSVADQDINSEGQYSVSVSGISCVPKDLSFLFVEADPNAVCWGEETTVSWTIENVGLLEASPSGYGCEFYLSLDYVLDDVDTPIHTTTIETVLPSGDFVSDAFVLDTSPFDPGPYYVIGVVAPGGLPDEMATENNTAWAPLMIQPCCGLTISSTLGGTVMQPGEGTFIYNCGESVPVEAQAAACYEFVGWTGTAVDAGLVGDPNDPTITVTLDDAYTLEAHFAVIPRTLTVSSTEGRVGDGAG